MTNRIRALWLAVAMSAAAMVPVIAAEQRRLGCLSEPETRDAILSRQTIPPFRALQVAERANAGESVSIRLCHDDAAMVYDVGVLRRDGRLIHVLVDAVTGALAPARNSR